MRREPRTCSRSSRRQLPTHRSAVPFCHGLQNEVRTGFVPRCFDELDDRSVKDEVAIEDEIFRSSVVGKRLTQLLNNPSRRRVEGGVEVNDVPTAVLDDEEAVTAAGAKRWAR